ncbi:hypothetical protein GNI_176930 [Gregarina niphandrodes]|uniref:Uncharacterized protein n=1 Tax=Gregarina niphandrodes TaxID=110365 RepID=A0A023AYF6_GRENI|nr:hypothetical protein GNI_176930 [Gregarina niphandrodes]EZG43315.1 hypothetical protein GNI_176930 [Gregarina niphandrodes]|eukprot:XP_011133425.1 hypothetical protein GNI_176930 [Gregarina niphandrodes]
MTAPEQLIPRAVKPDTAEAPKYGSKSPKVLMSESGNRGGGFGGRRTSEGDPQSGGTRAGGSRTGAGREETQGAKGGTAGADDTDDDATDIQQGLLGRRETTMEIALDRAREDPEANRMRIYSYAMAGPAVEGSPWKMEMESARTPQAVTGHSAKPATGKGQGRERRVQAERKVQSSASREAERLGSVDASMSIPEGAVVESIRTDTGVIDSGFTDGDLGADGLLQKDGGGGTAGLGGHRVLLGAQGINIPPRAQHRQDNMLRTVLEEQGDNQQGDNDAARNSFTNFFKQDLSDTTGQPDIGDTENTLTLLQATRLDELPNAKEHRNGKIQPDAEERPNPKILLHKDLLYSPSGLDSEESFDVSASQITPAYVQTKLRRQIEKQGGSHYESPLRADTSDWKPLSSLSPIEKLKLSRIGVPTPFTTAQEQITNINSPALAAEEFSKSKKRSSEICIHL